MFKLNFALVLLIFSAISSGAISPAFTSSQQLDPAETVFCPLTKKRQPIHPPKENLLDALCANNFEKENFSKAVIEKFTVKFDNFDNLENFVFDYWANGETAFENLPNQPFRSENTFAKNYFSKAGLINKFEHQTVWQIADKFSFQLSKRPPPIKNNLKFEFVKTQTLDSISHQLAPRAPPLFNS